MILEFIVIQRSFVVASNGTWHNDRIIVMYGICWWLSLHEETDQWSDQRLKHFFNWFSFSTLHLVHSLVAILYTLQ